jgi:uncharacterized membrane protein YgaE (UPF0421/DUF939 family)
MRQPLSERLRRLRSRAPLLLQAASATAGAWAIATGVLGHARPIFAPLSAIIAIGTSHAQRSRRAVELVVGVAVGIAVADLAVGLIDTGTWQLLLVTLLAMAIAVLLDTGPLFVTQAGVSAALVVTVQPPGSGLSGQRFLDALVGGAVALAITSLLPADPLQDIRRSATHVMDELQATLRRLAAALEGRDHDEVRAILAHARDIDRDSEWQQAVQAGQEIVRMAPPRRRARDEVETYATAAMRMDLAVRNLRVLARGVLRAVEVGDDVPDAIPQAMRDLAEGVATLTAGFDDPDRRAQARRHALRAGATATRALDESSTLSVNVLVGQIRSMAVDLISGLGEEPASARSAVREAADDLA